MKNYWLDRATLCVKESHFEWSGSRGLVFVSQLSNGLRMTSWIDQDGTMTSASSDWEDTDPGVLYYEADFKVQESLAEEKFAGMVSHVHTPPATPLEGCFSFFASPTVSYFSPKVEVHVVDCWREDCNKNLWPMTVTAVKFLHPCVSPNNGCGEMMNMEHFKGIVGPLYVTCPAGRVVMDKAYLWSTNPKNGYYLFLPVSAIRSSMCDYRRV